MARNEALVRRLGRATRSGRAGARRQLQAGDTLTLYAYFNVTCSESGQVRAVVRQVGSRFVWLDDLDNPGETFTDSELIDLEAFHARYAMPVHNEYFGPVSDVDENGRILALMTKEANRAGVGGWVSSRDLEGGARLAEQLVAYRLFGHRSGREMGYAEYRAGATWYGVWLREMALLALEAHRGTEADQHQNHCTRWRTDPRPHRRQGVEAAVNSSES